MLSILINVEMTKYDYHAQLHDCNVQVNTSKLLTLFWIKEYYEMP